MIQEVISKLSEKKNLTENEAVNVMELIMEGKASTPQIKEFLLGLKSKGETIEEITACAKVMRSKSITIDPDSNHLVDTCGTGGDNLGKINIFNTGSFFP